MDPIAVLRTIWQYRIVSMPILFLTFAAALYVFQFAPRTYETSATYAMINPDIPSEKDIIKNPELGLLNSKNPYLRSSDPSLIVQVLLTRMNDSSVADKLEAQGVSSEYTVNRGVGGINGFLVDITGIAETPEKSFATTKALGVMLEEYLYDAQKINGAADTYLFSSIVVASPDKATEQFSSRLRSLIAIILAGVALMFGTVSIARAISVSRRLRGSQSAAFPRMDPSRRTRKSSQPAQNFAIPKVPSPGDPESDNPAEARESQEKGFTDGGRITELTR